ncbi:MULTISPECIES: alpha/beta-type small acid-soluble spore protein [unclassified Paenibacillus]|uniref:alpha/beta-type small acid-soluble spore protein n=1 Tax=unclassified Paenibacillus TaxID=185978 RepID=UPI0004269578|nr:MULTISPECIES: alpha/beta-type small acid-soluble spore protein [unclassified Paenibacillus]KGP80890.1 spore protein [Paenibacillus sp. MAEPY2]KGP88009.1 spore protein [Paenibacillus sp. MAEPY1]
MARSNRRVVPESRQMLDQMKYEIAAEFGLNVGYGGRSLAGADTEFGSELGEVSDHSYGQYKGWGHLTSRENGSVGGEITKRLIRQAEQHL